MFGWFKKKDKDAQDPQSTTAVEEAEWGMPTKRKLSKQEAERDAAAQKMLEEKSRERRDMYRLPGTERIFVDADGRRLALRLEDNTGPKANEHHAPLCLIVFWGTRELGHLKAKLDGQTVVQIEAKVEAGFEKRGIASEILKEIENFARQKRLQALQFQSVAGNEWDSDFLTAQGFGAQGDYLVKNL